METIPYERSTEEVCQRLDQSGRCECSDGILRVGFEGHGARAIRRTSSMIDAA